MLSDLPNPAHQASTSRLFTPDELASLPSTNNPLDRKTLKQQAKKRAKQAKEAERKEKEADEDMFDAIAMFGGLTTTKPKMPMKPKKKKKEVKEQTKKGIKSAATGEAKDEDEFANFLSSMGADEDDDMEL